MWTAAVVVALAACGGPGGSPSTGGDAGTNPEPRPDRTTAAPRGEVVVLAAASLTDVFERLGEDFEAAHDGVTVTFGFGASSALAQQIVSGAPADVFAAASPATMAQVVEAGGVDGRPVVLVRNRLQIAVPAGNPGGVTGLADLADERRTIALCAEQVPCGAAAARAFAAAGITPAPDTLEGDVRAVLTKVELGEVDAGLVYRTDVLAAGEAVVGIDFPEAERTVNDYPVAALSSAPNPEAARAFTAYVLSDDARQVLRDAGFALP